jgi:hypothetical protein
VVGTPGFTLRLMAETQLFDERAVRRQIASLQIGQQPTTGSDHLEQSAAPVVILGVGPEVLGERIDSLREQSHLNLGRAGIGLVRLVLGDHRLLVETHSGVFLWGVNDGRTGLFSCNTAN